VFSLRIALTFMALVVAFAAASTLTAAAADPSPGSSPAPSGLLIDPLDPRAGAGANRVGAPLLALVAVLVIGVAAAAATAIYVRLVRAQ
jgi:hypothetical protein